jgi:hypothetical protein
MALEHKAFIFDYSSFQAELQPLLEEALRSGEVFALVDFINKNLPALSDPYEGERLTSGWWSLLEEKDAHQYGDFALTKYYDPQADIGLGRRWETTEAALVQAFGSAKALLGSPLGTPGNLFDTGKAGAYFQTAEEVQGNRDRLEEAARRDPALRASAQGVLRMLNAAAEGDRGLYVTF